MGRERVMQCCLSSVTAKYENIYHVTGATG